MQSRRPGNQPILVGARTLSDFIFVSPQFQSSLHAHDQYTMSRTRPPNIQAWACRRNSSTPLLPSIARPSLLPAIDTHALRRPNSQTSSPRLFHTTRPNHAVPAPSTRRRIAQQGSQPTRTPFPTQNLLRKSPTQARNKAPLLDEKFKALLEVFEKQSSRLYTELLFARRIDSSIDLDTFKRVGVAVLKSAYSSRPSAPAIEDIAQAEGVDLSTVFKIGHPITREQPELFRWLRISCAVAGERFSNLLTAAQQLARCHKPYPISEARELTQPGNSEYIARVKTLATQTGAEGDGQDNRDPQAMLIYAKYLGLLGDYKRAISLVCDVLRMIKPSFSEPSPSEDLTLGHWLESPWELFLWLERESANEDQTAAGSSENNGSNIDALRLGAIEYQDVNALRRYAQAMGHTHGIDRYEEYMGQAAAGGDKDACRHLANLYYLIYLGRYPRLGTSASKNSRVEQHEVRLPALEQSRDAESSQGLIGKILSYFGPRPYHEYLSLAEEWYKVAFAKGCVRSGNLLGQMYQHKGDIEKAEATLEQLVELDTDAALETKEVREQRINLLPVSRREEPKVMNLDL
ncbi:hypothetical protein BDW69DRAFT_159614 [Aspergillus filifer]